MADNFSDKVIKKLQKQNLAVDLTEEVVEEVAPETAPEVTPQEVAVQSQDAQAMANNDVTAFTPGSAGLTQPEAVFKDIIITPGPRNASQTHNTASQINFYNSTSAVAFDTTGYDQQIRTTIFNYIEGAEAPALVIGGYNGTLNLAPTTAWGGATPGVSGVTAAKIWIHPFTGKVDASTFDGIELVLGQTANTAAIKFGTSTVAQSSGLTVGQLGWTGSRLNIHDGGAIRSIAYTSDLSGAQDVFKTMSDGTNSAVADSSTDTFTFTAGTGITCTINASTDTLTIGTSNIPNLSLTNSTVTIGSTSVALGATVTSFAGLSSVTSSTFVGALTGNASTATSAATLTTARTIQGVSFNGSANITVVTNGTGVTVSGTQVSIGQAVGTTDNPTFAGATLDGVQIGTTAANEIDTVSGNLTIDSAGGTVTVDDNLTVSGNLIVNGTTVTVNATTTTIDDPIITLGGDTPPGTDDNKDRGIEFRYHNGTAAKLGFFGFDDSDSRFKFIPDATNASEVFSGTLGDIQATTFYGALSGNATTATSLATSGTVALSGDITATGVTYTGGGNITLSTAIGSGVIVDADINASAGITDTKLGTISTADKVSISALNIDGGTDIGADIADADLLIIDDGGAGTNRKTAVTRIPTYVFSKVSGDISIASNGAATIQANSVALGTDTAGNYVASITAGSGIASTGATTGETIDHTISLKNAASLSNNTVPIWTTASTQFANSTITDNGTIVGIGRATTITSSSALSSGTYLTITTNASDDNTITDYFIRGLNSDGTTSKFSVDANGNLRATTKSFDIPHPTKEGKRLVYGVLEGPEHGVYHRGTVEGKDKIKIELPEYWHKLVGEDYSVQLTSWGAYAVHLVEKTENYFIIQLSSNFVMRKLKTIKVDYVVHGARLDAPLEIEQ